MTKMSHPKFALLVHNLTNCLSLHANYEPKFVVLSLGKLDRYFFGMAAISFLCNGTLLFQGNLPRVFPVIIYKYASYLIPGKLILNSIRITLQACAKDWYEMIPDVMLCRHCYCGTYIISALEAFGRCT